MTPRDTGSEGAAPLRPLGGSRTTEAAKTANATTTRTTGTFSFRNRTVAVALAVLAVGYLVLAFQVPEYTAVNVPVQPGTLPRWLGVVLLVLAALLFLQRDQAADGDEDGDTAGDGAADDAAGGTGDGADAEETRAAGAGAADAPEDTAEAAPASEPLTLGRLRDARLEVGLFVAALVVYVALFEPLGFVLSTALYLAAMTVYLGYRRHVVTAVVSVGLPLGLYLAMSEGLGVVLPSGPLPF
ncbi:tripartite tricarboxylate transporter TctB family protein [Nocardiopsis sp. NPDC049922]|uniref:tripartite tricarboxylate transporter TctB family protein n=1 Tax=Nocardiopsis sp. NPDC049922 TaxID=3155157 RepID=UPI0033EB0ABA